MSFASDLRRPTKSRPLDAAGRPLSVSITDQPLSSKTTSYLDTPSTRTGLPEWVRLGELSDDMTEDHGKDDRDGTTNRDGPQHAFQTGIGTDVSWQIWGRRADRRWGVEISRHDFLHAGGNELMTPSFQTTVVVY